MPLQILHYPDSDISSTCAHARVCLLASHASVCMKIIFETGRTGGDERSQWQGLFPEAVCTATQSSGENVGKKLPPTPRTPSDNGPWLDRTFIDIECASRLACMNIMCPPAHSFQRPQQRDERGNSSIMLRYRNARRLIFARAMSEHIAGIEPRLRALRAKHYMFWCVVDPYETLMVIDFHGWFCNKQHPETRHTACAETFALRVQCVWGFSHLCVTQPCPHKSSLRFSSSSVALRDTAAACASETQRVEP